MSAAQRSTIVSQGDQRLGHSSPTATAGFVADRPQGGGCEELTARCDSMLIRDQAAANNVPLHPLPAARRVGGHGSQYCSHLLPTQLFYLQSRESAF